MSGLAYATAPNAWQFGVHRPTPAPTWHFDEMDDRSSAAEFAGPDRRFHVYGGWFSPASQRIAIILALTGLEGRVSMSYVDNRRDGRGWAFREATGPDPVNGFTLLREAYERTDSAFAGDATIPVLWDRERGRIVSNDARRLGIDLARWGDSGGSLYPVGRADEIEAFDARTSAQISHDLPEALNDPERAMRIRTVLDMIEVRLADAPFVLGRFLTDADIRLWAVLIRYDLGANAFGRIGAAVPTYPHIWRWCRRLMRVPAFARTTDLSSFAAPLAPTDAWQAALAEGRG